MTANASGVSSGSETPSPAGRVVVGIDGSDPSRAALRWAHFVAAATASTIEAVAVWQATTAFGLVSLGWGARPPGWDPAQFTVDTLQRTLDDVFGGRRPPGLVARVEQGNTAQVLIGLSAGARMLVVGGRGHGGFTGLLLGSVSAACTEHATCPVLVVHGTTPPPARTDVSS